MNSKESNMTTTITEVSTAGLDLAPALELRPRSEAVRARLLAGDRTAIPEARELYTAAEVIVDRFLEALRAHGWAEDAEHYEVDDMVWPIVHLLSCHDIGGLADELENPPATVPTDLLPANAVGIDGFDGWVELIEWSDDGKASVRFPNTGAEMLIVSTQLRSITPGSGLTAV